VQHFIKDDSDRPHIVFNGVNVALQSLGTHVKWRTNVYRFFRVRPCPFGKTEVSYFDSFVFKKDVGRFEIAVEKPILCNMDETHEYLSNERKGLVF
jgi:hypothetical protein